MNLPEIGKSTLLNKTGTMVGCGYGKHPTDSNKWINVVVYRTADEYVLCFSEGVGYRKINEQRAALGTEAEGAKFAQFAARNIQRDDQKLPFKKITELLDKSLDAKMYWLQEN